MHHESTTELPTVNDFSAIAATHNADKVAFGDGIDGRSVTWEAFDTESNRAANAFSQYVSQGDRIAFFCENSIEHTILWNGALKAGAIASNLHVKAAPNTIAYMINTIRPRVIAVDDDTVDFFNERIREKIESDLNVVVSADSSPAENEVPYDEFLADQEETPPDIRVREDDIAVIMWTSGTTGQPKGWCHTHRSLYLRAMVLTDVLELNRSARQPHVFTPSFAAWYSAILPALISGATTYFLQSWDPDRYLALIDEYELTTAMLVPTMWREMVDSPNFDQYEVGSLEAIVSAGEVLTPTTLQRLRDNVCETVRNSYASTEAFSTVMANDELIEERIESVGKPVPGVQIRIIDPDGTYEDELPTDEVGELAVNAPDSPVWAWGRSEKTKEAFEDGWWYSGDLGYKDDEGFLYLEGRTDFMIKSKGIKVYPSPIEERLNAHGDVIESAVVGEEDEEYGQMVVAHVRTDNPDLTAEELDEWCLESDNIARFERPREYRFEREQLPRTATGKLDRLSLTDD